MKCAECKHYVENDDYCEKRTMQNHDECVENNFECDDYAVGIDNNYQQHKKICEKLNETYINKNIAYGNSFSNSVKELGIISAVTRLYDKMERVKALTKGAKNNVKNERLEDTLLDLANYAIMTYMEVIEDDTTSN